MSESVSYFDFIDNEEFISLTTYYKSGKGVATPVEFVIKDNKVYVNTKKDSYKVKRIKNNPKATIAPCTMRGKLKGPSKDVKIKILNDETEISIAKQAFQEKLSKKSWISRKITKFFFWLRGGERVFLVIQPVS